MLLACSCTEKTSNPDKVRETEEFDQKIRDAGYNPVVTWEHKAVIKFTENTLGCTDNSPNGRDIHLREMIDILKLRFIVENPQDYGLVEPDEEGHNRKGELT